MSEGLEIVVRAALIGTGGTLALDLWNAFLKRFFGVPSLNLGMLGRWFGHFPRGRFKHEIIAEASPFRVNTSSGGVLTTRSVSLGQRFCSRYGGSTGRVIRPCCRQ